MTNQQPANARKSAQLGAMLLVAGFLSLMIANATIAASFAGPVAMENATGRIS